MFCARFHILFYRQCFFRVGTVTNNGLQAVGRRYLHFRFLGTSERGCKHNSLTICINYAELYGAYLPHVCVFIMSSLHDVREMNAYWARHICLSVRLPFRLSICPLDSTWEPLDGFGWNLVRTLCHWGLPWNLTSRFLTIDNTDMADEQTCEVGSTLAPLAVGPYNDV
jgi:hypothetical protein